jgi:hypothetical protein
MSWVLGGGGDAKEAAPTPVTPPSPSPIGGTELLLDDEIFTHGEGELKR